MIAGKRSIILFWAGRVQLKLHIHKTALLAVTEEYMGLFPVLLETTLDVSVMPLHDQSLHIPGEQKAVTPGLRETFHLSQLLTVAAL